MAIALWNNPAFQTDLTRLGLARADLVQAGLLQNPFLSLLFPWGPKQVEATIAWPIEALWLRGKRTAIAELNAERVAQALVQSGLDLVRDVKIAFADLDLARTRAALLSDLTEVHESVSTITEQRVLAGDVSEQYAGAIRISALRAREAAAGVRLEVSVAENWLLALLGLGLEPPFDVTMLGLEPTPLDATAVTDIDGLLQIALAARPELRAAELAIEAAGARAGLAQQEYFGIAAALDINGEGREGFEMGPGIDLPIPIFDRNQGGVSRAEAELEQAARRYVAVRHEIARQVRDAHAAFVQARDSLASWRDEIVPALSARRRVAERAQTVGQQSYLDVLEPELALRSARVDVAEATAAGHRARARLEHSVGRSIDPSP